MPASLISPLEQQEQIAPLPYKAIKGTATREIVRDLAKKLGRQTVFLELKKIKVRENFNPTSRSTRNIPELAESMVAVGLIRPLVVKVDDAGKAWLIFGHRRLNAIKLLSDEKRLLTIEKNGLDKGSVECFVVPANLTELDLLKMGAADNLAEADSLDDIIERAILLKDSYKITHAEIGAAIGKSRQWVDTLMLIEEQAGDYLKTGMDAGVLSFTNAGIIARIDATGDQKERFIYQFIHANQLILMSDINHFKESLKKPVQPTAPPKGPTMDEFHDAIRHPGNKPEPTPTPGTEEEKIEEEEVEDEEVEEEDLDDVDDDDDDLDELKQNFVDTVRNSKPPVVAPYDDKAEMKAGVTSAAPPRQQTAEKKLEDVHDAVIQCSDILSWIDKLNVNIGYLPKNLSVDLTNIMFHLTRKAQDHKETIVELVKKLK